MNTIGADEDGESCGLVGGPTSLDRTVGALAYGLQRTLVMKPCVR